MEPKHQFMINQLQKLKVKIGNGPDLTNEFVASCWLEEVDDLSKDQFVTACKMALEKCEFFPSTAKFRQFVIPPDPSPEELAIEATDRIITCLSTCGYTNTAKAREQIGELGWAFVQRMGGWSNQWRKSIMGIYNQALRGNSALPALPRSRRIRLQSAENILNHIMGERDE